MYRKLTKNFLHASIPSEPSLLNIFWQAVVWTAINEDMFQDSEYSKLTGASAWRASRALSLLDQQTIEKA